MVIMPSTCSFSTGTGAQFIATAWTPITRPAGLGKRLLYAGLLSLQHLSNDVDPPERDYRDQTLFHAQLRDTISATTQVSLLSR